MKKNQDWYQNGAEFAEEVQQALKDGKTFNEMLAFDPEHAARIRDIAKEQSGPEGEITQWYDGYVSRWD